MRIDQLLVQRGLANTRSQAQRLIADGVEWAQGETWRRIVKNGDDVPESAEVRLLDDSEARYVSRGGLKLEAALKQVGLSVEGFACLDVGQSTGGFTDCLLQAGAKSVVGVDVGSAQLHPMLRSDPRARTGSLKPKTIEMISMMRMQHLLKTMQCQPSPNSYRSSTSSWPICPLFPRHWSCQRSCPCSKRAARC
jgi:predicted rRNA methylase YqxC with S4 and FtsJ domains